MEDVVWRKRGIPSLARKSVEPYFWCVTSGHTIPSLIGAFLIWTPLPCLLKQLSSSFCGHAAVISGCHASKSLSHFLLSLCPAIEVACWWRVVPLKGLSSSERAHQSSNVCSWSGNRDCWASEDSFQLLWDLWAQSLSLFGATWKENMSESEYRWKVFKMDLHIKVICGLLVIRVFSIKTSSKSFLNAVFIYRIIFARSVASSSFSNGRHSNRGLTCLTACALLI